MQIVSFPPISSPNSSILILGTMPGVKSLEANQYYAHSQNLFWKIMFHLFNQPFMTDYEEKKQFILTHHIAVWDVLQACTRKGSLDIHIREEIPNNFSEFFFKHPEIQLVAFNGQKAAKLFHTFISPKPALKYLTLPSTSPANAGVKFEQKIHEWSNILV